MYAAGPVTAIAGNEVPSEGYCWKIVAEFFRKSTRNRPEIAERGRDGAKMVRYRSGSVGA
jgi:hypothetical protein